MHSFAPPSSPPHSYDCPPALPDDFAKEPPAAPPQLHLTLLAVQPLPDAPSILPRPQHVVLNHVYSDRQRTGGRCGATILGVTHRYRSKYGARCCGSAL
jgi:5'-AMP-activated protein kinase regulatory beta subunit